MARKPRHSYWRKKIELCAHCCTTVLVKVKFDGFGSQKFGEAIFCSTSCRDASISAYVESHTRILPDVKDLVSELHHELS